MATCFSGCMESKMTDNRPESSCVENSIGLLVVEPRYFYEGGFIVCAQDQYQYDRNGNLLSFVIVDGERHRIQ